MHIHPNNSLLLASLVVGREEVQEMQAKRAAEVRRRLSSASRVMGTYADEFSGPLVRVEAWSYESDQPPGQRLGEDGGFGRLFSAKA